MEKYRDPRILSLARKVEIQMDPKLDKTFLATGNPVCKVKIITKNGKEYEREMLTPRFMTKMEAEKKYKYLSSKLLSERRQKEVLDKVANLEQLKEVEKLTALLC
jgi:2-methylcitrate dehydratase